MLSEVAHQESCDLVAPYAFKLLSSLMGATFTFVVARLARLDFEISRLRMTWNPFNVSGDRTTSMEDRETARRHPLATKTPLHDQVVLGIKSILLVGSAALGDTHSGVSIAVLRLCIGAALLLAGIKFDEFFPARPGSLDWNAIQSGLHAAVTATYFSSLCAALAVERGGHEALDAPLISYLVYLVVPAFLLGFHLKAGRWPSINLSCLKMKAIAAAVNQFCAPQRSAEVDLVAEPLLSVA